jgi:hypothetical protein
MATRTAGHGHEGGCCGCHGRGHGPAQHGGRRPRSGQLWRLLLLSFAACVLSRSALLPPPPRHGGGGGSGPLVLRGNRTEAALTYAVQSRVYPEQPDLMVVTTRGAGLALYNISSGSHPVLRAQWGALNRSSFEGQDRIGDTMVVVDLHRSGLHVFSMSAAARRPMVWAGFVAFEQAGALHCRLHAAPNGAGLFALVSIGHGIKSPCRLAIVNVTLPHAPQLVTYFQTTVTCMEGVLVYDGHAYVGGYCDSHSLVVIALTPDIRTPRVVRTLHDPSYVNMVGALSPTAATAARNGGNGGAPLMYQALWAEPGGLAIFDIQQPAAPTEIGKYLSPNTSYANRVQLSQPAARGGVSGVGPIYSSPAAHLYAFLPLEAGAEQSGVAVIDVRQPRQPRLAQTWRVAKGKMYCLCTYGSWVYAFGANTDTMYIFSIEN